MARALSLIQATGEVHLGNYLGALRNWVDDQGPDRFYGIADLHALTAIDEPGVVGTATRELAAILFAIGLDRSPVFVQSHVAEHNQLGWLMECTLSYGELSRMTQFKDKVARRAEEGGQFVSAGLFTYPALMAADILLYDADEVPVGDDQRQHLEITRDAAERFNHRFGPTLTVPRAVTPKAGARIMDLQEPTNKMSKSAASDAGTIKLLDPPSVTAKKFKRAVTDSLGAVRYDPAEQPGVSNLLEIIAAFDGGDPSSRADEFTQYGPLKQAAADVTLAALEPIQQRVAELAADPAELDRLLAQGADAARTVARATLARAYRAVGLLAPA